MNKKLFWTLGLALITSLSMQAQDDDLYFTPSKKKSQDMNATVTSVRSNQQSASTQSSRPALAVYNNNSRDEDEYNRRNVNYAGAWQTGGGAEDSLVAQVDTVYVTSPDMYDPEADFIYSRRLLRFHSPRFGFALSSPYYWDLVYGYGVYNYLYDPFYWDLYDPFYWDYGWGYGWSWRPWYSSFYGWYSPYYAWNYWGVGPYWHSGTYYTNRYSNSYNRGTFSQNRYAGGTVGRTSAVAAANGTRNSFSSRTENSIRTSAARTNAATRSSVATSNNRISTAGNTRTVFNGNTVSGNANNNSRVVIVNRNDNNRTSAVRQNTQTTTRTQVPANSATQQRVTVPTTQRTTTTTTTSSTRSSAATSSFSSGSSSSTRSSFSTGSSFGGGGSIGGGASSGGARTSAGRR